MKVAIVYDAVYPFVKGGAEKRIYDLAKHLKSEIHVIGMKFWKGSSVIKKKGVYFHGICRPKRLYSRSGRRSIIYLQAVI